MEERGTWASRTRKRGEAGCGRPEDRGVWTAKTVKRPPQQPAQPPIRQLLGAADTQTAHPATFSTAPAHQLLGSTNAETTPAGAPAAAVDRTQRPDATCEGKNGRLSRGPYPTECHTGGKWMAGGPPLLAVMCRGGGALRQLPVGGGVHHFTSHRPLQLWTSFALPLVNRMCCLLC